MEPSTNRLASNSHMNNRTSLQSFIALSFLLLTLGACSTSSQLGRAWESAGGAAVPASAIYTGAGERHCDQQSATFLGLGRASEIEGIDPGHYGEYVRDPEGLFTGEVMGSYLIGIGVPPGAANTGYSNGKADLWVDPADDSALFVEVDGQFERWPRFNVAMGCD